MSVLVKHKFNLKNICASINVFIVMNIIFILIIITVWR